MSDRFQSEKDKGDGKEGEEKGKKREKKEDREMPFDPLQPPHEVAMDVDRPTGSYIDVSDNDSFGSDYDFALDFEDSDDLMKFDMDEELPHPASSNGTNVPHPLASPGPTTITVPARTSAAPPSPQLAHSTRGSLTRSESLRASAPALTAQTSPAPPSPQLAHSTRGALSRSESLRASAPALTGQTSPAPPSPQPAPSARTGLARHRSLMAPSPTLSTQITVPPPTFPQQHTTSSAPDWQRNLLSLEPAGPPPVYTPRAQPLCVVRYSLFTPYISFLKSFVCTGLQRETSLQRWSSCFPYLRKHLCPSVGSREKDNKKWPPLQLRRIQ